MSATVDAKSRSNLSIVTCPLALRYPPKKHKALESLVPPYPFNNTRTGWSPNATAGLITISLPESTQVKVVPVVLLASTTDTFPPVDENIAS